MSYADAAALATDADFMARVNACVTTEAAPQTTPFAQQIMASWGWGATVFMPWLIASPGFDKPQAEITDGDILAAVQANWARAEAAAAP